MCVAWYFHNTTTHHNNTTNHRAQQQKHTQRRIECTILRGGNLLERFLPGSAGRHKISQVSVWPVQRDSSTGITQRKLRPRKLPITAELRAIANMVGKSSEEQRRHMASRCIQQRARRIRINKSTILNITSQNLRSLSTTNNKKREELFHKLRIGYWTLLLPFLWMNVDWIELAH